VAGSYLAKNSSSRGEQNGSSLCGWTNGQQFGSYATSLIPVEMNRLFSDMFGKEPRKKMWFAMIPGEFLQGIGSRTL